MIETTLPDVIEAAWPLLLQERAALYGDDEDFRELDGKFLILTRVPLVIGDNDPEDWEKRRYGILAELTVDDVCKIWNWPWWVFHDLRTDREKPVMDTEYLSDMCVHMFDDYPELITQCVDNQHSFGWPQNKTVPAEVIEANRAKAPAWAVEAADNGYLVAYRFANGDISRPALDLREQHMNTNVIAFRTRTEHLEYAGLTWTVSKDEAVAIDEFGDRYHVARVPQCSLWQWKLHFAGDEHDPVHEAMFKLEDRWNLTHYLWPEGTKLDSKEAAMKQAANAKRWLKHCAEKLVTALATRING